MIFIILGLSILLTIYFSLKFTKKKEEVWIVLSVILGGNSLLLLVVLPFIYLENLNRLTLIERTFPSIVVNEVASTDDISVLDKNKLDSFYFPPTYLEVTNGGGDTITYEASNTQIINMYNRYLQELRTSREKDVFFGPLIPEIPKYLKPVVLISK